MHHNYVTMTTHHQPFMISRIFSYYNSASAAWCENVIWIKYTCHKSFKHVLYGCHGYPTSAHLIWIISRSCIVFLVHDTCCIWEENDKMTKHAWGKSSSLIVLHPLMHATVAMGHCWWCCHCFNSTCIWKTIYKAHSHEPLGCHSWNRTMEKIQVKRLYLNSKKIHGLKWYF